MMSSGISNNSETIGAADNEKIRVPLIELSNADHDKIDPVTNQSERKSSFSSNEVHEESKETETLITASTPPVSRHTPSDPKPSDALKLSNISERAKRKSWYNVIYPCYKQRSESFKKLFKEVPDDQRLIADYSCALQREILVHGRMFVSQHYLCFHANIFGWETFLSLKWKDIVAITKEKTALVIPNAILVTTETDKYFITSFAARDKSYVTLFRIWQNALMNKSMSPHETWQFVHNVYGDQLGLTSDDEDYIDPHIDLNTAITSTDGDNKATDCDKSSECDNVADAQNTMRLVETEMSVDDLSDTTDSESEANVPFVPTAECTSMHDGRQVLHTILPINVDNLFTMLFSKSKFYVEFHNSRKSSNITCGEWEVDEDGQKCRSIKLTVTLTQAVGPKTSNVTETQIMRDCSVPGQLYSIDVTSINSGIPYADSFNLQFHYCLVRTVDNHTMLSVYAQIKYTKSVWGVVKGFIERNIWNGLEDFYKALLTSLQNEYCIPPAKSKSRRTKRALQQKSSQEEPSVKSTIAKPISTVITSSTAVTSSPKSAIIERSINDVNAKPILKLGLNWDSFSMFVMALVIALILLNFILLIQLYLIQSKVPDRASYPEFRVSCDDNANGANTDNELREQWMKLLDQQKTLHEDELIKWRAFVKATINLLHNVKNVYSQFNLDLKTYNGDAHEEL